MANFEAECVHELCNFACHKRTFKLRSAKIQTLKDILAARETGGDDTAEDVAA